MKASATKLYGICKELGHCVDDCGLCSKINGGTQAERHAEGQQQRRASAAPPTLVPKATPVIWHDICDWCRRKRGGHYAWCQYK